MDVAIVEFLVADNPEDTTLVDTETGSETEVAVPLKDRYQLA